MENQQQVIVDVNSLKPIKSEGLNLQKYHKQNIKIEKAEVIQVPSKYTPEVNGINIKQWVLKVSSVPVASLGEGEDKIEFRASELFNLMQDKEGKLEGFPESTDSNLGKFMKDIGAKVPADIVGKSATIKAYDKKVGEDTRTYLKFLF